MDMDFKPRNFYNKNIISTEKENEDRKEKKFTDLILITPDQNKYHVHKIIISTRSSYFESLYHSNLIESRQSEIQLDRDILPNDFENLLTYIYTGFIEITTENVSIINENAHFFGLTKLKEASEKILANNINLKNTLTLWRWGTKFLNNELRKKCLDFILENTEVFLEKYLLSLKYDEIKAIASKTDLADDKLYLNLVNWIKEFQERQSHIPQLLKYINFAALSDDFKANEIETDNILISSPIFLKFMTDLTLNKKTIGKQKKNKTVTTDLDDLVFAIATKYIAVFNLKTTHPRFSAVTELNLNDLFQPIHFKEDKILLCGVEDGRKCKSFSYRTHVFHDLSQMLELRNRFGISKIQDKIYVCGGITKHTVESYDINTDKWLHSLAMPAQLYDFKVLSYRQSIYTFGGRCSTYAPNGVPLSCKEIRRYDPRENVWEMLCSDAIEMPDINDVLVMNNNAIRCFYSERITKQFSICGYDLRNIAATFELPTELPDFYPYNVYKSKDYVHILGKTRGSQPVFGYLDNLTTLTDNPVKFINSPGIDLTLYDGSFVKFLQMGAD